MSLRILAGIIIAIVVLSLIFGVAQCTTTYNTPKPAVVTRTVVVQEPATVPVTPSVPTAPAIEAGTFEVDPAAAKVTNEFNPDNGTTMKNFDIPNANANGYQVYAVGTEFEGSFYLLLRTNLNLTTANGEVYLQQFPEFLDMNIAGAEGQDFLYKLPLDAENRKVTVHFTR